MTEHWKPIASHPEYEVSDYGNVRRQGELKTQRSDRKGYRSVRLWAHNHMTKHQVSRLVAAAFIGPRPEGHVVAHNNGDNTDNRASNLRYCTPSENERDKRAHGTAPTGERHGSAKLTEADIAQIRQRYRPWSRTDGGGALAREFGVSTQQIQNIVSGRHWGHTDRRPASADLPTITKTYRSKGAH